MVSRMSGDEAREFVDDFQRLYADWSTDTVGVRPDPLTP
jgi:hypothetical protein